MSEENIYTIELKDKIIRLIGTAHVSKSSVEDVRRTISEEKPDSVCIELCESRYKSITDRDNWKKMDIVKVIKEKKATLLFVNLILSSFQKRIAKKLGVKPGQEMLQGIDSAKEVGAELVLADRNVQVTFLRVWRNINFWGRMKLLSAILGSIFINQEITEEDLDKIKNEDMLESLLKEIAGSFPQFKKYLIDERDKYLSHKIKNAPGKKVVAVVGAGHVPGILEEIKKEQDMDSLESIPPKSKYSGILGWIIPGIIILLIVSTFFIDKNIGFEQVKMWLIWNGSMAALGTVVALAHPLTILVTILTAGFSALHPLVAVGMFAGLTEAMLRKPRVEDFENIAEDIYSLKGFWKNKVTRILLIFVLSNFGSTLGTFIGGVGIIKSFFKIFS